MNKRVVNVILGEFGPLLFLPLIIFICTWMVCRFHRYVLYAIMILMFVVIAICIALWLIDMVRYISHAKTPGGTPDLEKTTPREDPK